MLHQRGGCAAGCSPPLTPAVCPVKAQERPIGHALYPVCRSHHIAAMALLKIARMGNPVLRRRAEPVEDPAAPWVRRLVADMIETMHDAGGTGLAAPQVHAPWRI